MIYLNDNSFKYKQMGIQNLNKLLKDNCPNIFKPIHLSEFMYKKVAIDTSLFMFRFKAVAEERWLSVFINLVASLRRNEVHCVFIYDGKAPEEKRQEITKRYEQKAKLEESNYKLIEALEEFHKTGTIDQCLIDLYKKRKSPKRLLKPDSRIDMDWVERKIKHREAQVIKVSPDDFQLTKELFDILDVPYYNAPDEAEKFCAQLCKNGLVDAVLSEDTDLIAYGTPIFLSKIDTKIDNCIMISFEDILTELDITYEQLLDICIMCGTDYNSNIPKIGPKNAFKLIKEHQNIENIATNTSLDISILNHTRGRELFTTFQVEELPSTINYCGHPNFTKLQDFINTHNITTDMETLKKYFDTKIVICDE
jgi:5'-3' exonuclease